MLKGYTKTFVLILSIIAVFSIGISSSLAYFVVNTPTLKNIFEPEPPDRGDIVISKTVTHPYDASYVFPTDLSFDFSVSLGSGYANKTVMTSRGVETADAEGKLSLSIKPGETVKLLEVDSDTQVSVTEAAKSNYTVTGGNTQSGTVIKGGELSFSFENVYTPPSIPSTPSRPNIPDPPVPEGTVTVSGIKTLSGREWKDGDTFSFILECKNSKGEYVEIDTATVSYDAQNEDFFKFALAMDDIFPYERGSYEFRVRELSGEIEDLDYDLDARVFTVRVDDSDSDGYLEIATVDELDGVTVVKEDGEPVFDLSVEFVNKLIEEPPVIVPDPPVPDPITVTIPIVNTVEDLGDIAADIDGYLFVIEDLGDGTQKQTVVTDKEGLAQFLLEFKAKDAGTTKKYRIYAVDESEAGITYSDRVYELVIDVVLNEAENKLEATIKVDGETVAQEDIRLEFTTESELNRELDDLMPVIIILTLTSVGEIALLGYQIHGKNKKSKSKSGGSTKLNSLATPMLFLGLLVPTWQVVVLAILAVIVFAMLITNISYAIYASAAERKSEPKPEPEKEPQPEPEPVIPVVVVPEPEPIVILEEVKADEVNELMSDAQAKAHEEKSGRYADPTKKGFINIDVLSAYFASGETVTLEEIKKRIPRVDRNITFYKVLARGTLDKALTVDADAFSIEAEKMILLTGGKVLRSLPPEKKTKQ